MKTEPAPRVAVAAGDPGLIPRAEALAAELELPLVPLASAAADLLLVLTTERLELRELGAHGAGPVYVDFLAGAAAYRRRHGGGKGQPLARAVGIRGAARPTVLDATAGLARDAFVLAALGCRVHLVERSRVVAALLADGLARAAADPDVGPVARLMTLSVGDATQVMSRLSPAERPETVYLDPMYPHSGKTALKGKEMRLFREIVGQDEDAPALLAASLRTATKRVTVKRPKNAPALEGPRPSTSIDSKNTRFDLYIVQGQ